MDDQRFARLTGRQRECLRLYHQRLTVKEIAMALGLGRGTVERYLTEAARVVDAGGRRAAATAYAEFEKTHADCRGRFSMGDQALLHFAPLTPAGREELPTLTTIWSTLLPLRRGAKRNELSIFDRLIPIPFIACSIALAIWALSRAMQSAGGLHP